MSDCGFTHMTEEQLRLVVDDAATEIARILQDGYHNQLDKALALEMGRMAVQAGVDHVRFTINYANNLNRLTASIIIQGIVDTHDY